MQPNESKTVGRHNLEHGATAAMRAYAQPNETEAKSALLHNTQHMTIDEVMMNLAGDTAKKVDTDFGAFGIVARMNTNFHVLKEHFNAKRRRGANEKIKQALRQIAADAVVAQTLL